MVRFILLSKSFSSEIKRPLGLDLRNKLLGCSSRTAITAVESAHWWSWSSWSKLVWFCRVCQSLSWKRRAAGEDVRLRRLCVARSMTLTGWLTHSFASNFRRAGSPARCCSASHGCCCCCSWPLANCFRRTLLRFYKQIDFALHSQRVQRQLVCSVRAP